MTDGRIRKDCLPKPPVHHPNTCSDLLMKVPVGVFTSTSDGNLLYANEYLASLFGYENPQRMVESITDLGRQLYSDPEDRKTLLQLLEFSQAVSGHECRMIRRNGSVIWVSIKTFMEPDETGRRLLHGFVSDITERRQAEEKFSRVFMTVPDCFAIVRMSDSVVIDVNEGFHEATGWSRETVVGASSLKLGLWARPQDFTDRRPISGVSTMFSTGSSLSGTAWENCGRVSSLPVHFCWRGEPHFMLVLGSYCYYRLSNQSLAPDTVCHGQGRGQHPVGG